MKVVLNRCHGGFQLSDEAARRCVELGMTVTEYGAGGEYVNPSCDFVREDYESRLGQYQSCDGNSKKFRSDPRVIQAVEELGSRANGVFSKLQIVDIPFDDLDGWHVVESQGFEHVAENHRRWPDDYNGEDE